MATTLTTSWQAVASYNWQPGTGFSITFYLDAKYSSQSIINNNTTIQTRLRSVINQGSGSGYNYAFTCSYAPTVSGSGLWTLETETITSGGDTISHNNDGTKTITLSASARINGISLNISFSGDAILPKINRYATLTSAPDFNDEANPKITFTKNVASGAVVYAGIFNSTGTTAYASYRDISSYVSTGEYTFNLTNTERTALRNATSSSKTLQVMFKLYTTISGTNFDGGNITKTMTIINATPTLTNATFSEQNAKVSALLGSSGTTVVQNASTIRFGITATALKSATITKVVATHNNVPQTDTSSPYSFDIAIKTGTITAVATDSRANTSSTYTKTWSGNNYIEYKPVSIDVLSFKRQTETSGVIILNLTATYYQKTFGSTANVPIVKWKKDNGSWTTLTSSQYTIANNQLTVSNLSLGNQVDYEHEATFYLSIEDKLSSAQDNRKVTIGIPTLELGKNDVKVNGQLYTDNIKTKNMLDRTTITQEDITGGSGTLRMTTRQIIWLEAGTYTASTNMSSSYNWGIQIQNIGIPPLSSWPSTWVYNTNWLSTGTVSHTFTINSGGWFNIMLRRSDNGTFTSTDITNLRGFHYQLEKGSAQTDYSLFQEISGYDKYCKGEQRIGTWVDGKPLYRKIDNTSVSLSQNVWTNLRYKSGEKSLIKCYISDKENFYDDTSCLSYPVIARLYGNYIQIYSFINTTAKCVIVEYTKTTD